MFNGFMAKLEELIKSNKRDIYRILYDMHCSIRFLYDLSYCQDLRIHYIRSNKHIDARGMIRKPRQGENTYKNNELMIKKMRNGLDFSTQCPSRSNGETIAYTELLSSLYHDKTESELRYIEAFNDIIYNGEQPSLIFQNYPKLVKFMDFFVNGGRRVPGLGSCNISGYFRVNLKNAKYSEYVCKIVTHGTPSLEESGYPESGYLKREVVLIDDIITARISR